MKSALVRKKFFEFFESKGHQIVPSAPLVVKDDPSLMFNNAGMNQFKEFFLGNSLPKYKRVADTQKCLRVSGKHNDLEEVGIDTYHHTFFEMLGNWSFGDYFKKEAIQWAWELLTDIFKIDKDRIYITVFGGAQSDKVDFDQESFSLWTSYLPKYRILKFGKKDNFWEMGDIGPCGPCSEIHVDVRDEQERKKIDGSQLVNKDHPQVIEIWNLVFIQYNRLASGELQLLPQKHVDTGMGFERLCMVLQKKSSNYATDIFTPLISEIETLTRCAYGKNNQIDIAIRVIADHLRTVCFSIADGQLPSNKDAGYVIRRILRRAVRYGFSYLNMKTPFIYRIVPVLTRQMKSVFPELVTEQNLITNVIKEEEKSFLKTLEQGLFRLHALIEQNTSGTLDGFEAFELYDTFGFPIDLTSLIAKEKGLQVDHKEFQFHMENQRERARRAKSVNIGDWIILSADDKTEFIGFDKLETKIKITQYRKTQTLGGEVIFHLVFNLTPFYPEGGGQVGDKGYLKDSAGTNHFIVNTTKENNLILHHTKTIPPKIDERFIVRVESLQRQRTSCNHTATHLLHQALRKTLGSHVVQKGSMIHSREFRFDFSHFSKLSSDQLKDIEHFVNDRIREQIALEEQRNVPYDDAINQGVIALFGEKYGDTVRIVRFGQSIELCGGTHVKNTSEIWHFKILSEKAIASGIRRIEAITGDEAKRYLVERTNYFETVETLLKYPKNIVHAITELQSKNQLYRKEINRFQQLKIDLELQNLIQSSVSISGISLIVSQVDFNPNDIRKIAFALDKKLNKAIIVLGSIYSGLPIISCLISKNLVDLMNLNAIELVNKLGVYIDGKGGGQAFFATAGGKKTNGLSQALKVAADDFQSVLETANLA